ncbi:MAG: type I-E CRISPR-associated endonuclease Cas1e [Armatimonadota bacterium]|nr:type I-E CRISPR-associated endonuclease Cas1e [Armatimonadota bacterium]
MPSVRSSRNLNELPRFRDGLSYLYVEHAVIEQEAKGIALYEEQGVTLVPVAALGVLALGPGTRITHAAIRALAENGCTVLWVGEDFARFYACGVGETRSASRLLRQARAWADPASHLEVVKRLYRFRFTTPLPDDLGLAQLRGLEGARVRSYYESWSHRTGVPWSGRHYDRGRWATADPINRALSAGAAFLYGLCHAAVVSAGYSPALGFIHVGKQLSFIYDVADLYKTELLVPAAFTTVAESPDDVESRIRRVLRERIREVRLLERAVDDLHRLFEGLVPEEAENDYDVDAAKPGWLWDPEGPVPGGVAYGGADPGESTEEPAG